MDDLLQSLGTTGQGPTNRPQTAGGAPTEEGAAFGSAFLALAAEQEPAPDAPAASEEQNHDPDGPSTDAAPNLQVEGSDAPEVAPLPSELSAGDRENGSTDAQVATAGSAVDALPNAAAHRMFSYVAAWGPLGTGPLDQPLSGLETGLRLGQDMPALQPQTLPSAAGMAHETPATMRAGSAFPTGPQIPQQHPLILPSALEQDVVLGASLDEAVPQTSRLGGLSMKEAVPLGSSSGPGPMLPPSGAPVSIDGLEPVAPLAHAAHADATNPLNPSSEALPRLIQPMPAISPTGTIAARTEPASVTASPPPLQGTVATTDVARMEGESLTISGTPARSVGQAVDVVPHNLEQHVAASPTKDTRTAGPNIVHATQVQMVATAGQALNLNAKASDHPDDTDVDPTQDPRLGGRTLDTTPARSGGWTIPQLDVLQTPSTGTTAFTVQPMLAGTSESIQITPDGLEFGGISGSVTSAPAAAPSTMPLPYAPTAHANAMAQQIANALADPSRDPGGMVELALDPPELGRLRMQMTEVAGVLTLTIQAERSETAELMRRHLDLLAREFAEAGLSAPSVQINQGGADGQGQYSADGSADDRPHQALADEPTHQQPPSQRATSGALDLRL